MDKETGSIAPSEATTLVNEAEPQQRTSLLGKPIERQHDTLTSKLDITPWVHSIQQNGHLLTL
jgi:hypothetical protein